jgi:SAM-dependent methyltransferase
MSKPAYHTLVDHYTACFKAHGATPKGVDWPKEEDAAIRHGVMLGVRESDPCSVLDLGCGYGALKDYIDQHRLIIDYRGIDLSEPLLAEAKRRHPDTEFELRDILRDPLPEESVDYVVMNGVLTERRELSFDAMEDFARKLIWQAFQACRAGIAFNVMSKHVDYERDDLFHWPFDRAAEFLRAELSPHYSFRADYGLYEYTAYVYRRPT